MSKHLSQTDINTLLTVTTTGATPVTITGAATAGGLINLLATAHGITNLNPSAYTPVQIVVTGVTGTTEANGTWSFTVPDANHITLTGSTFVHTYVSGGTMSVQTTTGLAASLTPVQLRDLDFSLEHAVDQPTTAIGTILAVAP